MNNNKKTILVVDDTPVNIDVLSGILRKEYKVKAALNGEKALKIAQSEPSPSLIILDIMMPGIDGYEVCRRLKSNPLTSHIPVIFISAKNQLEDQRKGLELGAVDYITKPIAPSIVEDKVRVHLSQNSHNATMTHK